MFKQPTGNQEKITKEGETNRKQEIKWQILVLHIYNYFKCKYSNYK